MSIAGDEHEGDIGASRAATLDGETGCITRENVGHAPDGETCARGDHAWTLSSRLPLSPRRDYDRGNRPGGITMKPINDVQELFRHQRAIRAFTDDDVPDDLVNRVLTAAIHGPSGSNTQPWHFIVIRDRAVKQAISDVYEEARADAYGGRAGGAGGPRQPLSAAPVLIVACVKTPASGQAGFQTGASIYPSVQNLMLAARALGLGTVLTTLHRRRKARIHEILGIPDNVESAAIIPLGWPDRGSGPNRRPGLERFVMRDRWADKKS